jgi:rare lipoprotein A
VKTPIRRVGPDQWSGLHGTGRTLLFLILAASALGGCFATSTRGTTGDAGERALAEELGEASYYADRFEGRATASGELFRQDEMTAAHRTYPFGTVVRVTNLAGGRHVILRINDRGPAKASRLLDVTRRAAGELGMLQTGVARVRLEVLRWGR